LIAAIGVFSSALLVAAFLVDDCSCCSHGLRGNVLQNQHVADNPPWNDASIANDGEIFSENLQSHLYYFYGYILL
jgi:hypothetical protein